MSYLLVLTVSELARVLRKVLFSKWALLKLEADFTNTTSAAAAEAG